MALKKLNCSFGLFHPFLPDYTFNSVVDVHGGPGGIQDMELIREHLVLNVILRAVTK